jgi:hypothetical protein
MGMRPPEIWLQYKERASERQDRIGLDSKPRPLIQAVVMFTIEFSEDVVEDLADLRAEEIL